MPPDEAPPNAADATDEDELFHRLLLCDPTLRFTRDDEPADDATRAGGAYRLILWRIIRGELAAGQELKTTQLARDLGLSRTPVREALAALTADGIVEQKKNQRAIVRPGAENWLVQIHQLRVLLEPAAAAQAARKMPASVLRQLDHLARAAAPQSSDAWQTAARRFDYALHLAIAEHCGNLPMRETIRKCWSYKRLSYEVGKDAPDALALGYHEHVAIRQALAARSPETASAAMLYHLQSAGHRRPAGRIV